MDSWTQIYFTRRSNRRSEPEKMTTIVQFQLVTMSIRMEVEVGGEASSQRAANRARPTGDNPDQMIAAIRAYHRAGVEHIVLALNSGDIASITALMADVAQKVVPECRRAPAS